MDGILNISKPAGETSFKTVSRVKKLTGERHAGHAGTLDPMATGVLPICLGKATHLVPYLMETRKTYRAEVEFGITTDTYDMTGKILGIRDPGAVSREALESALDSFRGEIRQTPPMYSAVKHEGKPLYKLARAGITVERKSRPAAIYQLDLLYWQPPVATIEVVCGKGTYIRSLAHDLGQALDCGAALRSLVRSKYGPFEITDSLSMAQFEEAARYGYWEQFIYPLDSVLLDWSAVVVSPASAVLLAHGRPVVLKETSSSLPPTSPHLRSYTGDGTFLGIVSFDYENSQCQPKRMFV